MLHFKIKFNPSLFYELYQNFVKFETSLSRHLRDVHKIVADNINIQTFICEPCKKVSCTNRYDITLKTKLDTVWILAIVMYAAYFNTIKIYLKKFRFGVQPL